MIEEFKSISPRKSGVIYSSLLEQIKKLYEVNPEQAGELAISAIELVLTGDISSNDMIIGLMLEPMKAVSQDNKIKYEQKVEASKQKKIADQKLEEIAELKRQGFTQKMIAERLGLTQQVVSYRWGLIKANYPELCQDFYKNTKKQNFVQNCTDNSLQNSCKDQFAF